MAGSRTTKGLAKRIEPRYIFQCNPLRRRRAVAVIACIVLALLWCAAAGPLRHHSVLSPGHVSAAHAMWNSDCARCHTGGNYQRVSDDACRKCHEGAIHHPNQKKDDFISGDRMHAARCAECHIEHRGRTMLAAVADGQCVACHGNINASIRDGASVVIQNRVTAFTNADADHPSFGRIRPPDGQPLHTTTLKFNHAKHLPRDRIRQDCTVCHTTANPDPRAQSEALKRPPWCDPADLPSNWTNDSPRRYFRQISYQRSCSGCHRLDVADGRRFPGLIVVPHVSFVELRDQREKLATPPNQQSLQNYFDHLPPEARAEVLANWPQPHSDTTNWAKENLDDVVSGLSGVVSDNDAFVTFLTTDAQMCSKCHKYVDTRMHATAPTTATSKPATEIKATAPSTTPTTNVGAPLAQADASSIQNQLNLATAPTNLPPYPRRWFPNSKFDHGAHRNMNCVECHIVPAEPTASTQPAATTQSTPSAKTADDSDLVSLPQREVCVRCHVPKESGILHLALDAAPATCITCHDFHDRNRETPSQGIFSISQLRPANRNDPPTSPSTAPTTNPATQPVAAAQKTTP